MSQRAMQPCPTQSTPETQHQWCEQGCRQADVAAVALLQFVLAQGRVGAELRAQNTTGRVLPAVLLNGSWSSSQVLASALATGRSARP